MTKAIINKQLVTVKVLKERKLFWLFEQVLVAFKKSPISLFLIPYDIGQRADYHLPTVTRWIPKSNLIEE